MNNYPCCQVVRYVAVNQDGSRIELPDAPGYQDAMLEMEQRMLLAEGDVDQWPPGEWSILVVARL